MDLELRDKLALVTGSTAGIGSAIAAGLAREGAIAIVNGRTERRVNSAIKSIQQKLPQAKLEGFAGDLATADGFEALKAKYTSLDILVNNLGIFNPQPFEDITDDESRRVSL